MIGSHVIDIQMQMLNTKYSSIEPYITPLFSVKNNNFFYIQDYF